MEMHHVPQFHAADAIPPIVIAVLYIIASSLLKEPNRRNFNAIMSGGFGVWEFVFTALLAFCAYRGLQSYRFIGISWLLHTMWDVMHHLYGNSIIPFIPTSSAGCAITDTIIAIWFFADAPSVFDFIRLRKAEAAT